MLTKLSLSTAPIVYHQSSSIMRANNWIFWLALLGVFNDHFLLVSCGGNYAKTYRGSRSVAKSIDESHPSSNPPDSLLNGRTFRTTHRAEQSEKLIVHSRVSPKGENNAAVKIVDRNLEENNGNDENDGATDANDKNDDGADCIKQRNYITYLVQKMIDTPPDEWTFTEIVLFVSVLLVAGAFGLFFVCCLFGSCCGSSDRKSSKGAMDYKMFPKGNMA